MEAIEKYQQQHQKIVLVTGVFDVLHQEHLNFLKKAKAEGDVLVVGIESDVRVKQMKGEDRPLNTQDIRKYNLEQTKIPDLVLILPEDFSNRDDHEQLIKTIKPTVLAVSSHTSHLAVKQEIMSKYGGEVKVVHQFNPDVSTTQILKKKND